MKYQRTAGGVYFPNTQIKPDSTTLESALGTPINRRAFLRASGAVIGGGLAASCAPALVIEGEYRGGDNFEQFSFRAGQRPKQADLEQIAVNILMPISAFIDSQVFHLYSKPVEALNEILCNKEGYFKAFERTKLPKDVFDTFYKAACQDYSESRIGEVLEKLNKVQINALTSALKGVLNESLEVYNIKSQKRNNYRISSQHNKCHCKIGQTWFLQPVHLFTMKRR